LFRTPELTAWDFALWITAVGLEPAEKTWSMFWQKEA
jgi:hypothetical protein